MKLVYFEDENGNSIAVVAKRIIAFQQKPVPTRLPTIVFLEDEIIFHVRNSFDECQKRFMAAIGEAK